MKKQKNNRNQILFSNKAQHLARTVLEESGEEGIGEHLGVRVPKGTGERLGEVAMHRFRSLTPGYKDWEWIVVLATVPGSGEITVNETSLRAGKDAELAPEWVPYIDRVRPGDLGPGDTLPVKEDDERLATWKQIGNEDLRGFPRNERAAEALSAQGLEDALQRWHQGDYGPDSEFAEKAAMTCKTCAFYLPVNSQETHFGLCTNEYSADGHVVHETYGCGAHSETKENFDSTGGREYGVFDDGF